MSEKDTTKKSKSLSEPLFRNYLKKNLPKHMHPQYIVHQKSFPITGNQGKINRQKVKEKVYSRDISNKD